jgi:transaldolase
MKTELARPAEIVVRRMHDLAREGVDLEKPLSGIPSDPFWRTLRGLGTDLWLDTGDIDGARKLWTKELSALTTNNTLLNAEVQRGIYDDLIRTAAGELGGVQEDLAVMEIAFLLNARHGLRLARIFGAKVSVELHTALSNDIERSVDYGRRFHEISPDSFIVKVPLTAAGIISARRLRREGIPVNFTLGFSARHNFVAARFAGPSYVNVFLGRLNAYVAENNLGDGMMVGEKATLASQRVVTDVSRGRKEKTLQIAASMRSAEQVADLAGVDVFTMPPKVAEEARKLPEGKLGSRLDASYEVRLAGGVDPAEVRIETLWNVSDADLRFTDSICDRPPDSAGELAERAREEGARDLFPRLSPADLERIARDGKVPKHAAWRERIRGGELAVDTLLNLAGLASFTESQRSLDDRIRRLVRAR